MSNNKSAVHNVGKWEGISSKLHSILKSMLSIRGTCISFSSKEHNKANVVIIQLNDCCTIVIIICKV